MAVVLHRLELLKGGLTIPWLRRVRLFDSAGWSVHVALLSRDPDIDETLCVLRGEGLIPGSVVVHHFDPGRRYPGGGLRHPLRPREIVRDGLDGFVAPVHDIKAAAQAVVRLLTDPDLRDRMSRSAREVTTRFSGEAHDRAWLALGCDLYDKRGKSLPRPGPA